MNTSSFLRAFTLIEILVVIGMLSILATVVLVAVNPMRQFAQARNTQREANVSTILNAVGERLADNRGLFAQIDGACTTDLPDTAMNIAKMGGYDLRPCLVPNYLSELPVDPSGGVNTCDADAACVSESYDTGYTIHEDSSMNRVTICAPKHEEPALANSEAFCLTR